MKRHIKRLLTVGLCVSLIFAATKASVAGISGISGDINGDGKVNNKDLTRLFQYLSDWNVTANTAMLDVNGDGKVNNKDLTRLFQFLSGWEVNIFPEMVCEHTQSEWTVTKDATYTEDGSKSLICSRCGKTLSTEVIPKLTAEGKYRQMEEGMLALMNAERAKEGVAPLALDTLRHPCAELRVREITELFSHTRPNGKAAFTVINELGYDTVYACAENIAYFGYYSLESDPVAGYTKLHNTFMNSAGHRGNILSESYTSVALAFTISNNCLYVVQIFFG